MKRKWSHWDGVEQSQVCAYAVRFGVEQTEIMGLGRIQDLMGCRPLTFQGEENSAEWGRCSLPHLADAKLGQPEAASSHRQQSTWG